MLKLKVSWVCQMPLKEHWFQYSLRFPPLLIWPLRISTFLLNSFISILYLTQLMGMEEPLICYSKKWQCELDSIYNAIFSPHNNVGTGNSIFCWPQKLRLKEFTQTSSDRAGLGPKATLHPLFFPSHYSGFLGISLHLTQILELQDFGYSFSPEMHGESTDILF